MIASEWIRQYPSGYSAVVSHRIGTLHYLEIRSPNGDRLADIALLLFSREEAMQKADLIVGTRSQPDDWSTLTTGAARGPCPPATAVPSTPLV